MARRGRPRKGLKQKLDDALKRCAPADHILAKRELYSFVIPTKAPEGRAGSIDQDICDGIGQLHALGLLDGHGHEAQLLRDTGREWRNHYVRLLKPSSCKVAQYERADKGAGVSHYTHQDAKFDLMDEALTGMERVWLQTLLIDPVVGSWPMGEQETPWVRRIIGEALLRRKRLPPDTSMLFPTAEDYARLNACIRGLCQLVEASLPPRWVHVERSAA